MICYFKQVAQFLLTHLATFCAAEIYTVHLPHLFFVKKKVFETKNVLLCLSLVRGNALGCRCTWKSSVVFTLDVTHPSDTTPSSATPTDLLADFVLYSFVFPLYNLLHSILLPASVLLLSTAAGVFLH